MSKKLDNRWFAIYDFNRIKKSQQVEKTQELIQTKKYMDLDTQKKFDNAFRILFTGDLILLEDQVKNGFDGMQYDYEPIFDYTRDYIQSADFSIGIFEGPAAGLESDKGYSSSNYADGKALYLNYHDSFADDVRNAGYDLVTTSTNHILDIGEAGALRTIEVLKSKGLNFVGSYSSADDKKASRIKIVEKDGLKIAVLAYTFAVNNRNIHELIDGKLSYLTSFIVSPKDSYYERVKKSVEEDFIEAKKYSPDLIVVLPHWGTQFADLPDNLQKTWNQNFIQFGADIILGDHTHYVQLVEIKDIDGRKVFTAYCPGNFMNIYREYNGDASAIIEVYIDRKTKKIFGGSVVPMWIQSPIVGNYRPLPIYKILNDMILQRTISTNDLLRSMKFYIT